MVESQIKPVENTEQQVVIETPRVILRAATLSDAIPLYDAFSDPEVMRYWSTPPHTTISTTETWLTSMIESPQNGLTDFIISLKPAQAQSPLSSSNTPTNPASVSPTPIPIGKVGIYRPPPSNEIGFLLSRAYWGKGLAKEALTHILNYLFSLPSLSSSPATSELHSSGTTNTNTSLAPPDTHAPTTTTNDNDQPTRETPSSHNYTTLTPTEQLSPHRYPSISTDVDPRNAASRGILNHMGFKDVGFVEKTDFIGGEWVDSVFLKLEREGWLKEGSG